MSETILQGRRIAVIGNSGAGKSTLARTLSLRLGIPHIELDALNWQPGWRALSLEEPETWSRLVAQAVDREDWVTDGNYSKGAQPHILPRATDVIWLDYSRAVIMARVLRRSFLRALSGWELWPGTGNREDFRRWLRKDHPIRWSWDTYRSASARRAQIFAGPALDHARKHRLHTPSETRRWLARLGCAG
ncbi:MULTISPECIES: P-loop NTPase family protein [Roseomonadaceae]|nr:ATP-binding cassette domain-containing protein [Roseomonas oleicola]